MSPQEKRALINTLAEKLLCEKKVEIGRVSEAISELTGIPKRTIYFYLDRRFKQLTKPSFCNLAICKVPEPPYRQVVLYLPLEVYKTTHGLSDLNEALKMLICIGLKTHGLL
jgi:hypothetical protein